MPILSTFGRRALFIGVGILLTNLDQVIGKVPQDQINQLDLGEAGDGVERLSDALAELLAIFPGPPRGHVHIVVERPDIGECNPCSIFGESRLRVVTYAYQVPDLPFSKTLEAEAMDKLTEMMDAMRLEKCKSTNSSNTMLD
jgi:hypothetical protein